MRLSVGEALPDHTHNGPVDLSYLDREQPSDERGDWREGGVSRPAWSAHGFTRRGQRYWLRCRACKERREAPLQRLVDEGKGDQPLHLFRGLWRCECTSTNVTGELD